ncbi:hypothetical protein NDU88_007079 [Pleurodeles waltl]|uniref:Uncharacterized protein n=1 Tax=Pleurodeles waltl TaxID=8319 RepID=A0AAV7LWQ3_PLEWA|nr:hypothetical protein NDU88_007079 [Pleurodeles waltl]
MTRGLGSTVRLAHRIVIQATILGRLEYCDDLLLGLGGPDNWRRGGPTVHGSVTTHDDINPTSPAWSRGASVHQQAPTVSDHTAGRYCTATHPQAPQHHVVCSDHCKILTGSCLDGTCAHTATYARRRSQPAACGEHRTTVRLLPSARPSRLEEPRASPRECARFNPPRTTQARHQPSREAPPGVPDIKKKKQRPAGTAPEPQAALRSKGGSAPAPP